MIIIFCMCVSVRLRKIHSNSEDLDFEQEHNNREIPPLLQLFFLSSSWYIIIQGPSAILSMKILCFLPDSQKVHHHVLQDDPADLAVLLVKTVNGKVWSVWDPARKCKLFIIIMMKKRMFWSKIPFSTSIGQLSQVSVDERTEGVASVFLYLSNSYFDTVLPKDQFLVHLVISRAKQWRRKGKTFDEENFHTQNCPLVSSKCVYGVVVDSFLRKRDFSCK